jgi:APA family basic amino acid/polyamine antiporter
MLLGQPRIFYAMAKDGLLPPVFARVHPKFRTPSFSTVLTGVVAAAVAGMLPVTILGELVSIGTLLAFIVVCIGVLVLRRTRPDLKRPFRVAAPWFVCTAGALICAYMMISLPKDTWVRLIGWTFFGVLVYVFYGRKHSALGRKRA